MKWIGRILYAILVVIIGSFVLRISQINALLEYYNENAVPHLIENERESYMEGFMTANYVEDYLKDPIYLASSNDETYNFEFAIYHLRLSNQEESDFSNNNSKIRGAKNIARGAKIFIKGA